MNNKVWQNSWLVLALCMVLGWVLYANSLAVPFYLDDARNIVDNPHLHLDTLSLRSLGDVLANGTLRTRPVSNLSFALNYYFNQKNVAGYHAVNILIHIFTAFFLYQLAFATLSTPNLKSHYSDKFYISLFTALIWLAHPLQTQSVTYIVQRMNSLAAMFFLLSLWLYARGRLHAVTKGQWKWFTGSFLAGLLALGSKEIAATLPFFIVLYEWYFFQDLEWRWLRRQAPLFVVLAVFCVLLAFVYLAGDSTSLLHEFTGRPFTRYQRVLTEFRVVLFYLSLLAFPLPGRLNLDHQIALSQSLLNPVTTALSLGAIVILLTVSCFLAKRYRLLSFAILWYFGNLAIESSIVNLEIIFEHRTYLPSVFVIFAATALFWQLLRSKRLVIALALILICLYSVGTVVRNNVWRDPVAFWVDSAAKAPGKARPWINLSVAYREQGQFDRAIAAADRAIRTDPRFVNGFVALATAYLEKGEPDQAIRAYREALERMPDYAEVYNGLAKAYLQKGMTREAVTALKKSLELKPSGYDALVNMGTIKAMQGRYGEAIADLRRALQLGGNNPDILFNLALVYTRAGDIAKAMSTYEQVLKVSPGDREARHNLEQLRRAHSDIR